MATAAIRDGFDKARVVGLGANINRLERADGDGSRVVAQAGPVCRDSKGQASALQRAGQPPCPFTPSSELSESDNTPACAMGAPAGPARDYLAPGIDAHRAKDGATVETRRARACDLPRAD